jgi:mono/diheme cytochrome c family protein
MTRSLGLCFAAALLATACHPDDIDPMERQPKLLPYATSEIFSDGRAMRAPPPGTIPRERDLAEAQPEITQALLALGRARFDVVCAPCHGIAGDGESVVASKMELRPPPSLHEARIRDLDAATIYRVISDGYGLMPRFSTHLAPRERWAVVAYVRALQLSQRLPIADAPEPLRQQLQEMK